MASQYDIHIRTDLDRPLMKYSFSGAMFSKDNKAHLIDVTTYKNNQMVPITGTIEGIVRRNDGKRVGFEGDIINGVAYIELPDAAYESDGPITVLIRNRENAYSTIIGYMSAYVSDSGNPEYGTGGTYVISISEIQEKLNEIDPLIVRLQTLNVEDLSDLTDYLEDISDVLAELETLDEDLTEAITEARDLAYSKVNRPEEDPDGTSGQVLRTKGDGTTEWADVGAPTDAQATTAINAWLAAHPEYITTIDDGEITEAKLHADLKAKADTVDILTENMNNVIGVCIFDWESGGLYYSANSHPGSGAGEEYDVSTIIRTKFYPVTPGDMYRFDWKIQQAINIYGYASNTKTSLGVNERLSNGYKSVAYASQPFLYTIPDGVNYIRVQIVGALTDEKPVMTHVDNSILLNLTGKIVNADITADTKANYFDDADNAPVNSVYSVSSTAEMANTPLGPGVASNGETHYTDLRSIAGYQNGILYTYRSGVMTNQIFISATKNSAKSSDPTLMWFRSRWSAGLWSDWHAAGDRLSLSASNIIIVKKMIAPYLDADENPTAADTGTPNPQYMGDDPRIFNDFNDAPINKMYQIDLNCDATVMANNPMPGKSSVLATFGFGYASTHGRFQLCVGLNYPNAFAFVRYGYYQSTAVGFVWTPWANIVENGMKTHVENGTDLNTVKASGVYLLGSNAGYTNAPSNMNYGFLTVKTINVITCQTVETSSATYTRMFDGSSWTGWR